MAKPRKNLDGKFPIASPQAPLFAILVGLEDGLLTIRHASKNEDKIALARLILQNPTPGTENKIYGVWPGQTRSDVFEFLPQEVLSLLMPPAPQ